MFIWKNKIYKIKLVYKQYYCHPVIIWCGNSMISYTATHHFKYISTKLWIYRENLKDNIYIRLLPSSTEHGFL